MESFIPDKELFFFIAQGDEDAKNTLDERYVGYSRAFVARFLKENHGYDFEFDDCLSEVIVGYNKALVLFDYEKNDNFYLYFKIWAEKTLTSYFVKRKKELENFYDPKMISLDSNLRDDEDQGMMLHEVVGEEDPGIEGGILASEIRKCIESRKSRLTKEERRICELFLDGFDKKEIRAYLNIPYKKLDNLLGSISFKLKPFFKK